MAGYSGTPLQKKLGLAAGRRVVFLDAPDGFAAALAPLPAGLAPGTTLRGSALLDLVG